VFGPPKNYPMAPSMSTRNYGNVHATVLSVAFQIKHSSTPIVPSFVPTF
jgi:hypothetical protein